MAAVVARPQHRTPSTARPQHRASPAPRAFPSPNRDRKGAGPSYCENFPPQPHFHNVTYLITFCCYGQWLPGEAGVVDLRHNRVGGPAMPESKPLAEFMRGSLKQEPYSMDQRRRSVVLSAIVETCRYRRWTLLAAHVRRTHVHVVVNPEASPERVMNDLKSYASRALHQQGIWARHGSTKYLWTPEQVSNAVTYVIEKQGEQMEVYAAPPTEPRP